MAPDPGAGSYSTVVEYSYEYQDCHGTFICNLYEYELSSGYGQLATTSPSLSRCSTHSTGISPLSVAKKPAPQPDSLPVQYAVV